ncbi:hypothetical protein ACL02R_29690, partial [Streptomyces sp. MS19]|uniref:hypothetical protein n=1 Tax=Streptomyces sp. MS19 TaxID=3385972 RepID=UPI0039A1C7C9
DAAHQPRERLGVRVVPRGSGRSAHSPDPSRTNSPTPAASGAPALLDRDAHDDPPGCAGGGGGSGREVRGV